MWYFTSREPTHWSQAIFLGSLWSEGLHQVAAEGPGGGENPLELQGGDHVGITGVMVGLALAGIEGLEARGQDHGPDLAPLWFRASWLWSMAPAWQATTHCMHSEQTPQLRHRAASRWACSSV